MANPVPVKTKKVIKKHNRRFVRHQSDRFARVGASWRKPKGIDGRVRRRFKGPFVMPKIGYGSDKRTKFLLPNGFFKFRVQNLNDLEILLMNNQTHCAEIGGTVGRKKRQEILKRAEELNVKVLNGDAKLSKEEE